MSNLVQNPLDTPKATLLPDIPIDGKLRMVASRKICILHYGVRNCQEGKLSFDLFDDFGKGRRIVNSNVGQDFAVESELFGASKVNKFWVS